MQLHKAGAQEADGQVATQFFALISNNKVFFFYYFTDDANKKVELTQKWSSLLEAGKNEGEIEKELGQPKLDDVTAKRAKKIIKKLNKEAEAAVSSWDITSYLVGIFIFSYHIYVILKAIHGIYLFQD